LHINKDTEIGFEMICFRVSTIRSACTTTSHVLLLALDMEKCSEINKHFLSCLQVFMEIVMVNW